MCEWYRTHWRPVMTPTELALLVFATAALSSVLTILAINLVDPS